MSVAFRRSGVQGATLARSCQNREVSEANVELVRRGYAAVMRGDLEAIRALLDPNVKWHGGDESAPGACRNRDEALAFMRQAQRRQAPGELVDVIDAGDRIVVVMRRGSVDGEPAALSANVTTFRDGRVVEMVHYSNPEDALAAARA